MMALLLAFLALALLSSQSGALVHAAAVDAPLPGALMWNVSKSWSNDANNASACFPLGATGGWSEAPVLVPSIGLGPGPVPAADGKTVYYLCTEICLDAQRCNANRDSLRVLALRLYAVDAVSGATRWEHAFVHRTNPARPSYDFHFPDDPLRAANLAVSADSATVYVWHMFCAFPEACTKFPTTGMWRESLDFGYNATLVALDAANGRQKWNHTACGNCTYRWWTDFGSGSSSQYKSNINSNRPLGLAVNPNVNGKTHEVYVIGAAMNTSAELDHAKKYLLTEAQLHAVDGASGKLLWARPATELALPAQRYTHNDLSLPVEIKVSASGKRVYMLHNHYSGTSPRCTMSSTCNYPGIVAVAAGTGEHAWTWRGADLQAQSMTLNNVVPGPKADGGEDDAVYYLANEAIFAISAANGTTRWAFDGCNGVVDTKGVWDCADGRRTTQSLPSNYKRTQNNYQFGPPAVSPDGATVYAGSGLRMYAVDARAGCMLRWSDACPLGCLANWNGVRLSSDGGTLYYAGGTEVGLGSISAYSTYAPPTNTSNYRGVIEQWQTNETYDLTRRLVGELYTIAVNPTSPVV